MIRSKRNKKWWQMMTRNKNLIVKNNAPFRSCISKIYSTFIDNAENLEIVISVYNLLEYCGNYSMTARVFWSLCRDEINDSAIENNGNKIIDGKKMVEWW